MSSLYHTDFAGWADETAQLLAQRRFEEIDLDALIEEVEGLAASDRRAYCSHLQVIIVHLLKLRCAPPSILEPNERGWQQSIRNARRQLEDLLDDSPSAARDRDSAFAKAFRRAMREVKDECDDFGPVEWPNESPWSIDDVLGNTD